MVALQALGRFDAWADSVNNPLKTSVLETLIGLAVLSGWPSVGSGVGHASTASESESIYTHRLTSGAVPREKELLQKELIRLQEQTGLSLVTLDGRAILDVDFKRRELVKAADVPGAGLFSRNGTEIAFTYWSRPTLAGISRSDGSDFREYPDFSPRELCWSPDGIRLLILLESSTRSGLYLWGVKSDTMLRISEHGSLTSQCWSPDGNQITYEDETVKTYDLEQNRLRELGPGTSPTWSPDGEWIAFRDHDSYYAVRPDGQEKKQLFQRKGASSPLWWSPDTRFVAYVATAGMFAGGLSLDVENYRLRVRRLTDNSDEWVANSAGGSEYQWVTNPMLLQRTQSRSTQK